MSHHCKHHHYPDAAVPCLTCDNPAVAKVNGNWYCASHLDARMERDTLIAIQGVCKACGQVFTKEVPKYVAAVMSIVVEFCGFTGTCGRCRECMSTLV